MKQELTLISDEEIIKRRDLRENTSHIRQG